MDIKSDSEEPLDSTQEILDENEGGSNLKKILEKINDQNGLSMPSSAFVDKNTKGFRELNEDFTTSRIEEGPYCCAQSTIFDRIPTQLLGFLFMIFIGILGLFNINILPLII
jgi:hypothetical protein